MSSSQSSQYEEASQADKTVIKGDELLVTRHASHVTRHAIIAVSVSLIITASILTLIAWELRNSWLQARCLSFASRKLTFQLEPGPSTAIRFPRMGPYDQRLGYTYIQDFTDKLAAEGFDIEAQARFSPLLFDLTGRGIFTIYHEKSQTGLCILDRDDQPIFTNYYPKRVYKNFDSIPSLIVKTLLFIENRELTEAQAGRHPYRNPAVEWDRLAKAVFDISLHAVYKDHDTTGGSTLATQLEKFRHSPEGRTSKPREKLRQMTSAALRAYLDGKETLAAQRQIVLDYINSIPLAAIPGYGEVNSLGDGLWAWYGADFDFVNRCLSDGAASDIDPALRALVFKQVLSLFLAQRRPSFYLVENQNALKSLTNNYILMLAKAGVIPAYAGMKDYALRADLKLRKSVSIQRDIPFLELKAANAVRVRLSSLLDVPSLYDLDRLDLTVKSTLDRGAQDAVVSCLQQLRKENYASSAGIIGYRLLSRENLSSVIYSFTLYERRQGANLLRIQADSLDQPLNINEGVKLELGSTAKLRTVITYLEIIADLHKQYANLSQEELQNVRVPGSDRLSQWAISYISTAPDKSLLPMLEAAIQRRYSANPKEKFFTGGGEHRFSNFDNKHNGQVMSVRDGLLNSVNLVFIRLMRDIVNHYMYQVPGSTAKVLESSKEPTRQVYLSKFADQEGRVFLERFYRKYQKKTPKEFMDLLLQGVRPVPSRLAVVFRSVFPEASLQEFAAFMRSRLPNSALDDGDIKDLYEGYSQSAFNLADRGYIARVHPLELWTVGYLSHHPEANWSEVAAASADERQAVYTWLFKTRWKHAQDIRIRTILELEAFQEIYKSWKRLGYPFEFLVPSLATAIGSSADRPASLAELVGIALNNGVRYPIIRIQSLQFAKYTPYETILRNEVKDTGEQVLAPEVAQVVRNTLLGVVEEGTAQRVRRAFVRHDKSYIVVGGKTGTGDNRREIYGPRGKLIESRSINRTATFVFFIGDRFFGTITTLVAGPEADRCKFTSSLPVQIIKILAPKLIPLIDRKDNTVTMF